MKNHELEKIEKMINELREKIEYWNYEYYILDNPSVDDAVYDRNLKKFLMSILCCHYLMHIIGKI